MQVSTVMIRFGEIRMTARYLMNAIEEWRGVHRVTELSENERFALRFMYTSARKILMAAKALVDEFDVLRKSDRDRLAADLEELAEKMRELDGNQVGAGNKDGDGQ